MMKNNVRTPEQALAYLTDCTLATVCDLAGKKSAPKWETERQISIAQTAIDWMRAFRIDSGRTRSTEVINEFGGSVSAWASKFRPQKVTK